MQSEPIQHAAEQGAISLFAFSQRRLGLFARSDISAEANELPALAIQIFDADLDVDDLPVFAPVA